MNGPVGEAWPRNFDALVVDDEPDVRELLVEHLRAAGLKVSSVGNGHAAITDVERRHEPYGLIVADLNLPGADGLAVLQAAKQRSQATYVVMISGYATLDSAISAVRLGAYDYLTKPFSLGQIDVLLRRVRDRLWLEAENRELAHRMDERRPVAAPPPAPDRLSAIEQRLGAIELLLRDLVARRP